MGIGALVLGILAIVIMWIPVLGVAAIPLSIVGIILGVLGKKQASGMGQPTGSATAGLVLSIIALILSAIFTLICGYLRSVHCLCRRSAEYAGMVSST